MPHRSPVFVHLLPALIPPDGLKGGIAVVLDVLRATTTMIHALAAGCDAVIPCLEIDEAKKVAATYPAALVLLGGERKGMKIEGFNLGNSPGACTRDVCSGKTLVMTTTNGTKAILASLDADRVLVAGFVNRKATIEALLADGRPIHVVCSGTDGQVSLEDTLLAGAIAQELDARAWEEAGGLPGPSTREADIPGDTVLANDGAEIAAGVWRETESLVDEGYSLADALRDGRGGQNVMRLGLDKDIEDAARLDRFPFAAELLRDPIRIVPATGVAGPRLRLFGAH